jgi:ABC-2 type transport system permease protein
MRELWLVAKHEFLKMVRRRAFWLGTLGVPVLIIVAMGLGIYASIRGGDQRPIGYVDQAGVLAPGVMPPVEEGEDFIPPESFPSEEAARAALEADDIQAFYVLPEDYLQTHRVTLYYWENAPNDIARSDFAAFLEANLATGLPEDVRQRILEGSDLTIRSLGDEREVNSQNFLNLLLPFAVGAGFVFAVMASAGYLLQAVTDEKENRMVEILFTSLTPAQLMGGKALGLIGVALSQLLVWGVTAVSGLLFAAQFVELVAAIEVPWLFLFVIALYFLPAYVLVAGVMLIIGSVVTETRQGQQIAGIINLMFTLPFFFVALVFANPDHPFIVALTLFPTTSFLTVALRWSVTTIPAWQLIVSWVLLTATAAASIWMAARIFRIAMLRYGQRLDLRGVRRLLRS